MIDLYNRQAIREGEKAVRRSLGQQATVEPPQGVGTGEPPAQGAGIGKQPIIDTSNALGSLAELLGPTPAEREARIRKQEQSKAKMAAWTGLFDGLRQLGNLYYTSKGAAPQQFTDPYAQIDKTFQEGMQRADDIDSYRRQYAQQLYALKRQAGEDARKDLLAEAQAKWYGTKEDTAQQNAELAKKKAVTIKELKNGSLVSFDPSTGELTELKPTDPLYIEYMKARTNKLKQPSSSGGNSRKSAGGSNSNTGDEETLSWTDEKGVTHRKKVRNSSGNTGGNGRPKSQNKGTSNQKKHIPLNWK